MEPLDEKELTQLLRQWEAPSVPASFDHRVLPRRTSWWRWLVSGTIRIPVPVGLAAVVLVALWIFYLRPAGPPATRQAAPTVSLVDFQPVHQLEPVIVAGEQK